jgi:uncharacterized short protein YbdD (DUF466 family)
MRTDMSFRDRWKLLLRVARASCGLPDYEARLAHCLERHPERTPPSRAQFYREREAARYARGRSRCC